MVRAGGEFSDTFVVGMDSGFSALVDARQVRIHAPLSGTYMILPGYVFHWVTGGDAGNGFFGQTDQQKPRIRFDDRHIFGQPVLLRPGNENLQYTIHGSLLVMLVR
jgi:hypothetical protein